MKHTYFIAFVFIMWMITMVDAEADTIRCYSNNKLIYSQSIKDLIYTGYTFIFTEIKSNMTVITNAECVSKID